MKTRAVMSGVLLVGLAARAQDVELLFKDPAGDDDGPGGYTYPTHPVYKPGSFDLTELRIRASGENVTFEVSVNSELEDSWGMETGFSVQMVFIHLKTGPGGSTKGLPGTTVAFAPDQAWNRVVILSPQPPARVRAEAQRTANDLHDSIVIPDEVKGMGRTISATVPRRLLAQGSPAKWGYQVIMQSNEGFPLGSDLLTRKVSKIRGQHRFGGGTDFDCEPNVMDILAGVASGARSEVTAQHEMLRYRCGPDGGTEVLPTLRMVYR